MVHKSWDHFYEWLLLQRREKTGPELFVGKGCNACHELEAGKIKVGPSLKDLTNSWGGTRPIEGGTSVTIDAGYIRKSLLTPLRAGGRLPAHDATFQGQLTDNEIETLIMWFKVGARPQRARGRR